MLVAAFQEDTDKFYEKEDFGTFIEENILTNVSEKDIDKFYEESFKTYIVPGEFFNKVKEIANTLNVIHNDLWNKLQPYFEWERNGGDDEEFETLEWDYIRGAENGVRWAEMRIRSFADLKQKYDGEKEYSITEFEERITDAFNKLCEVGYEMKERILEDLKIRLKELAKPTLSSEEEKKRENLLQEFVITKDVIESIEMATDSLSDYAE